MNYITSFEKPGIVIASDTRRKRLHCASEAILQP
jgi:hypothetical protein